MRGMRQASNRAAKTAISFQCWVQESERGVSTSWVAFISTDKRGCSSNGRALASHARGKGIDAPLLQKNNSTLCVYIYIYTRFCVLLTFFFSGSKTLLLTIS